MKYIDINIGDEITIDWEDRTINHKVIDAKDTFDATGVDYTALYIDNMPTENGCAWIDQTYPISFNITQNKEPVRR